MKFKIFTLLFVIALTILGYFAYPILKSRYFDENKSIIKIEPPDNANQSVPDSLKNIGTNQENSSDNKNPDDTGLTPSGNSSEAPSLTNITPAYCNSECSAFENDPKYLRYCQQVCGLSPTTNNSSCENKTELEKDYCLKDLGIAKKDFQICNQIQDAGIKKTCQNRITEDIIENQ
jgi:hypothetical protein